MKSIKNLWASFKSFIANLFSSKPADTKVEESFSSKLRTMEMLDRNKAFNEAWLAAEKVEFNPKWENGTGYFDHAAKGQNAPVLAVGQMIASMTEGANDRKLIIIGTDLGNVVVFQRYTCGKDSVFAFNCGTEFNTYFGSRLGRPLSSDDLQIILGNPAYPKLHKNVGIHIANLKQTLNGVAPEAKAA